MKVNDPTPSRQPATAAVPARLNIKIGPVDPKVLPQLGRLVDAASWQGAILAPQLRLSASEIDKIKLPKIGELGLPKPAFALEGYLSNVFNTYQKDTMKAGLKADPSLGATGMLLVMTGTDCVQKLFDKDATPPTQFAAGASALSSAAGLFADRNPAYGWMGSVATGCQIVDFAAGSYSIYSELQKPDSDLAKCAWKGLPILCNGVSVGLSLFTAQFPQLAGWKSGFDTAAMVFKAADKYFVVALENSVPKIDKTPAPKPA